MLRRSLFSFSTNDTPVFLGVKLDRTLSFRAHLKDVQKKMKSRLSVLRAISGKSWGCNAEDLRLVHQALVQSVADYCSATWSSFAAPSTVDLLEPVQNHAARIITGACRSSPTDLVLLEAGLLPLRVRGTTAAGALMEQALRLPESNPLAEVAHSEVRQRLSSQRSWRNKATEVTTKADLTDIPREPLLVAPTITPWTTNYNANFNTILDSNIRRTDDTKKKRDTAITTLSKLPKPDIEIWTDGSAAEGTKNGGSGGIIVDHRNDTTLTFSILPASTPAASPQSWSP
jgi:hypothetical protein